MSIVRKKQGLLFSPDGRIITNPAQADELIKDNDYVVRSDGKIVKRTEMIAPIKTSSSSKKKEEEEEKKIDYFDSGAFGRDDINLAEKTVLGVGGTILDTGVNIAKGILNPIEGIADFIRHGTADVVDFFGGKETAQEIRDIANESDVDWYFSWSDELLKKNSMLGKTSENTAQGVGQVASFLLPTGLAKGVGLGAKGVTAVSSAWTGLSAMGSGRTEAYLSGATDDESRTYGLINGTVEAGTEAIFGGLGKVFGAVGLSSGLSSADDVLAKNLSTKLTNVLSKNLKVSGSTLNIAGNTVELGVKAGAEGLEEVIAGFGNAIGKKVTYMSEEELSAIIEDEQLLESFVVGALTSGIAQSGVVPGMKSGSYLEANKQGKDFVTGYTQNEQAVIDKEVENRIKEAEENGEKLDNKAKKEIEAKVQEELESGEISVENIERALGEEAYKEYDNLVKESEEFEMLRNMERGKRTDIQDDRLAELKKKNAEKSYSDTLRELQRKISDDVRVRTTNDSFLQESYREKARRGESYQADLTKYDSKQAETIQRAIDSGILNNTRKTHKFVDLIAKLSADKGVSFDFTNNEKLKESGFAIEGKTVNGFVQDGKVTLNINSAKALNKVVGHEITHVLEGTELYDSLQQSVFEYAKTTGEYDTRFKEIVHLYRRQFEGEITAERKKLYDQELTADLVGDYIFTNEDFVRNLSVKNRNVFQKIFDEIKYMVKHAGARTEAERKLLEAQRMFEKVYRETSNNTAEGGKNRYSLSSIGNSFFGDPNVTANDFEVKDDDGILKYKNTEGYKKYVDQCVENYRQTRTDFDEVTAREEIESQIDGIIEVAVASKKAGYDIFDYVEDSEGNKRDVTDLRDSQKRLLFSSLEPNSEYLTSHDISTICDKRKNFAEIYDDIVRAEEQRGVPQGKRFFDKVDNYFYIHDVMAKQGLTQPCRQCYVESMRKNLAPMSSAFMELITETNVDNKSNKQLYNQSGKLKGQPKTNNAKLRERVLEELENANMTVDDLSIEMLSTAEGLAQLRIQAPLVYEAFNSFYGQSKPKMPKQATPFRFGELTAMLTDHNGKINQNLVKKINSTGGFRLQSYSDFQIQNYTDVLQVLFEAGTLGLNGHAYTKVPAFLTATEGTNLKRNISIFMYKDGNEWKIDRNDSFPYELEEIYKLVENDKSGNTGIIAVSQNNEMSAWIMANDKVGYGIPFHKSGIKMGTVRDTDVRTEDGRIVKGYKDIKDHTRQQTEVWARDTKVGDKIRKANTKVSKGINIYEFWDFENKDNLSKNELIEKNVKRYIDECIIKGYKPKFRDYVENNSKILNDTLRFAKELGHVSENATIEDISFEYEGYRIPYGYYKFLGDFGMFAPDGTASSQKPLSLSDYDFKKAVAFFQDSETLRRNELLQQFSNGKERAFYRDGNYTNEQLEQIIKQKRQNVVDEIIPTKYSISRAVDSDGNNLSIEQQERFKDSKVRDENGNLKPLYHGTESMAFTEFNIENGVWLSETMSYADVYAGNWHSWRDDYEDSPKRKDINGLEKEVYADEDLRIYKVYADIKNPLDIGEINGTLSDGKVSELANKLGHYVADKTGDMKQGGKVAREVRQLAKDYIGEKAYNFTRTKAFMDYAKELGFDGFEAMEGGRKTYCVFNSADQLKLTTNQKPTSNPDIRYSLGKDNEVGKFNIYGSEMELLPTKENLQETKEILDDEENLEEGMFAPPDDDEFEVADEDKVLDGSYLTKRDSEKIRNIQSKIEGYNLTKDVTEKEFDSKISRKQSEYEALKNKDTKKATDLLKQITNLKAKKDSLLAEMDRMIDGQNRAIENVQNNARFRKRQTKQQALREWASDLLGNTMMWQDKKIGLQYQVNTLKRNLRDIVRDEYGNKDIDRADRIHDELQGVYRDNEAKLNNEMNAIKKVFMEMKINKVENEYIQMLGELRHNPSTTLSNETVEAFYNKNKAKIDTYKVDRAIEESRKLYDSLYERVNEVLREHGFKEIEYRKGYFPHFVEEKQNWLQKVFNWKTRNDDIPTDIAGLTEEFNPQRSWQTFDKHRKTDETDYNFTKGLDNYVQGALDWIYHIEDIQKRRAIEQEIRYRHSDKGLQAEIDKIRNNPFLSAEEVEYMIDEKYKEAKNPLGNFLIDFRNMTNNLAGKKSTADRSMEYATNRHIYSTMTNLSNRVTGNMVAGSVSSALTNFIPITQSWGTVSPLSSLVAMRDTIKSQIHDDGTIRKSSFLTNRLAQGEMLYKTWWDKRGEELGKLMEVVDNFTSQTVWRSKYMENIKNGMSEAEAIRNADQYANDLIAGRSRGEMPTIFNSKNPVTKMFTAFQLEVANQYGHMAKDMPQEMWEHSKGKLVKGYATMFVGAWVYNALLSTLTGRDSAFDPIGILQELIGDLGSDDEEEKEGALGNFAMNIAEEVPFIGGLLGGGRIPIASALPYDSPLKMVTQTYQDIKDEDWKTLADEWSNPLYYLALPMGGGQIRKSIQGNAMFDDDLPVSGSYTNSGKLRFPVEDTFLNRLQANVFGQYASANAREYFDRGESPLGEKQISEYKELDLPIKEYWDYRDGLKEAKSVEEKFEYIDSLDLPVAKKNIMINNAVSREDKIDMSEYSRFGSYEEFDWYSKNTEKYNFLKDNNVSYKEYTSADEDTRDRYDSVYNWYKKYPEKVAVSKLVTNNVLEFREYQSTIEDFRADKDSRGKSISGTAKRKKINYINSLNLDYGAKCILYREAFYSDNTYNNDIVNYVDSQNISYQEKIAILEELGMKVDSDGNVRW